MGGDLQDYLGELLLHALKKKIQNVLTIYKTGSTVVIKACKTYIL